MATKKRVSSKAISFSLGQVVATQGALATFTPEVLGKCLARHARGDWGNVYPETKRDNDRYARRRGGYQILSVYKIPGASEDLWIITEGDWSVTTLLLPDEN